MESSQSRIFVKGLPPTFTEAEFRKHFSQKLPITDAKIFPNRRIGYIGYKTPDDAQKAVKYFNRSFIRMSKIGVELAKSVQDAKSSRPLPSSYAQDNVVASEPRSNGSAPTKRKRVDSHEEQDPKLKEFLSVMKPQSKKKAWENDLLDVPAETLSTEVATATMAEDASDDEYEVITKKQKVIPAPENAVVDAVVEGTTMSKPADDLMQVDPSRQSETAPDDASKLVSDQDWARSRTNRLLGLLDDEEEEEHVMTSSAHRRHDDEPSNSDNEEKGASGQRKNNSIVTVPEVEDTNTPEVDPEEHPSSNTSNQQTEDVRSTMRLFVRNLPYDVKNAELESEFSAFGSLEEIHVPRDSRTGSAKGFALIQFSDPDAAERAMTDKDGRTFQGRLLHILPAKAKRETRLDDFEISKLPLKKQQQIKKKREAASTTFNWNALYMNADAVVSSVADRLGLSKSEVLDPTSSDAAVKQAHAETHIIQETKSYFKQHGVDLDAFKKSQRGDTAILVKNIPYDCSRDELRRLLEEHGELKRFLMPPSGVIAIVEFTNAVQCQTAFGSLAYRKIKNSVLFLEKAPKDLFTGVVSADVIDTSSTAVVATSAAELRDADLSVPDAVGIATLFVRNLNFSTTTTELTETFKPLDGFLSARVKTKTDPKKPGQILSMGFGFLEFRSAPQAQAALHAMDGYVLAGHKLQIRASHKGADAAEERRKADAAKKAAGKRTKVIIKNLPFEATKKDVRALFGAYGQLRSVRVPKKMDRGARGFAFADFTTPKEAESAMDALKDTHLLGRRLVLDFAEAESQDAEAEIEKMQQKVGAQVNKMALQKLTSGGRKKFTTANDDLDEA